MSIIAWLFVSISFKTSCNRRQFGNICILLTPTIIQYISQLLRTFYARISIIHVSVSPWLLILKKSQVFTHKNRKKTYKIKIYGSTWRSFVHLFLVLSGLSAVSTSIRRKGKRSSTRIKVLCVVSLDMSLCIATTPFSRFPEHRENVAPH